MLPAQPHAAGETRIAVPSPTPVVLRVRAKPNARAEGLTRDADGGLVARVKAAPVDGRANAAIQALLARALDVPRRGVTITGGARSRQKRIAVAGISPECVQAAVERLHPEPC